MYRVALIVFFSLFAVVLQAQQLAFPGAVGFGRYATGGRGGTVYHVTNLNDSGSGSFRDAVSQSNRIIVFDVAGIIIINSRITFAKNLTIAGQTAPGEGVVVYGDGVSFSSADNMICRYMRFRMGIKGTSGKDAAGIANGGNMIFDHVSVTWGRDETFSVNWDNKGTEPHDITIQNSIIGQGLVSHSAGGLVQTNGGVTLFRNLYIDNKTRNPKVKGLNQYVNNVVYNWGEGGCYILGDSEGTSWATIVNNYFIKGPSSTVAAYTRANQNFQLYASGNYVDLNTDGILNGILSVQSDYGDAFWVNDPQYWANVDTNDANKIPQMHPDIDIMMPAEEAYNWIVDSVGAILPVRDKIDMFLIDQLTSLGKKGELISTELSLPTKGPGTIYTGKKLTDTDNDGMPDEWEDTNGTDKTTNDSGVIGNDGYSNIEKYINSIAEAMPYLKSPTGLTVTAKTDSSVTIKWTNLEEATKNIVEYSKTNSFSSYDTMVVDGSVTQATVQGLESYTLYYFRVKSATGDMESGYSNAINITTSAILIAPVVSINPSPGNGAVLDDYRKITLTWENKTGYAAGPLYYTVYMGTTASNLEPVDSNLTASSCTFEKLAENTTYYWRIDAKNVLGTTPGDVWSFTTGQAVVKNMVAYFPFDESTGTTTTNEVTGAVAVANNFTPEWVSGIHNNAIYFPGTPTNQNINVEYYDGLYLNNHSFTISLWFKSPGGIDDSYLFHKGMHDSNYGGNGRWIGIEYKNSTLYFAIDDNSTKTVVSISSANKWFDNEWHHLACIRDVENDQLFFYIDGELKGSTTDETGEIGETENLILGNRNGYFDNPYIGALDELKIFDSALSSNDVEEIYESADTLSTGVQHLTSENFEIKVMPNPFTRQVTVRLPEKMNYPATIKIVTARGIEAYSTVVNDRGNGQVQIDLGNFSKGIYLCILKNNEGKQAVRKIIK